MGLTKTGNGILILDGHSSYTGGTVVQGGRMTNGTGATTGVLGRLEAQTVTAFGEQNPSPSLVVIFASWELRFSMERSPQMTWLMALMSSAGVGQMATTSPSLPLLIPMVWRCLSNYTSVLRAATQNASIGSLTVNAPQLTLTEGLVFVSGTSTFSQANTILRTAGGRLFLQGQVNAGSNTITKIGANDLSPQSYKRCDTEHRWPLESLWWYSQSPVG